MQLVPLHTDPSKCHYLLEKLIVDNLEAIQVIFKINLLLS